MKLNGARVLVTGATGGIGEAIVAACAAQGASVIASGRRADALEPIARSVHAEMVTADLSADHAVEGLLAEVGDLDVVVANAALPGIGDLYEFTPEQIDRALNVNLRAPMLLARLAGEQMLARGRGHLVFVNSLSGKVASGQASIYNATKFGLRGFALALREDMRGRGVGVSSVYPGFIRDAGMFAKAGATAPVGAGTRSPGDVAAAVVRAVEHDIAEIDVASAALRASSAFGLAVPHFAMHVQRRLGAKVMHDLASGMRDLDMR
ncbi:SDR family NAD(P)-dependent oxidoreductase [Nocardia sp. ET3-3]|uniref:SDR family NAD(P)-dependent oxidoreductase n=1 Tax=Nocardia terrae TaxID=2675851 RepID=A0A7K1US53_9NOCA|nr:SDR family NAD(P)-dependent oxidoreductase [Nocardia terrae]MVU77180.1 SDR family NAD(P)-dependent oxidoreductase [Nocardia terrae]